MVLRTMGSFKVQGSRCVCACAWVLKVLQEKPTCGAALGKTWKLQRNPF